MSNTTAIAAAASSASAAGSWASFASEATLQMFGVPIGVVLAAMTGAFGARVFMPNESLPRVVVSTMLWTCSGAFLPQLALWMMGIWLTKDPPHGAMAGAALIIAFGGQRVVPILWGEGGDALKRRLSNLWKG
jgi:hypothetical protein